MTTPPIPTAMRKAGYDGALNAPPCEHFEGDPEREGFATCLGCTTDAALAAAMSVCEVREEWGVRYHDLHAEDGLPVEVTWWNPTANRRECEEFADSRPWGFHARVIRRLVITSPAEQVDTEGAPA